jgi:hypothetical protein
MFECRFNGRLCVMSLDAVKDIARHGITSRLLVEIIECGEDYRDTKMSRGEIGRCIRRKDEFLFAKLVPSYSTSLDEEVWLVKHVGRANLK